MRPEPDGVFIFGNPGSGSHGFRKLVCTTVPFLLSGGLFIGTAFHTFHTNPPSTRNQYPSCKVDGDPDIAGLGTRLAVYMQLVATALAGSDYSGVTAYITIGNIWSLAAAFSNLAGGVGGSGLSLHDGYLLLTLSNGILLTMMPGVLWLRRFAEMRDPFWFMLLKHAVIGFWMLVSVILWSGLLFHATLDDGCPATLQGWFFVPLNLSTTLRQLHLALGVLQYIFWLVCYGMPLCVVSLHVVWGWYNYEAFSTSPGNYESARVPTRLWPRLLHYLRTEAGIHFDITFAGAATGTEDTREKDFWNCLKDGFRNLRTDSSLVARKYQSPSLDLTYKGIRTLFRLPAGTWFQRKRPVFPIFWYLPQEKARMLLSWIELRTGVNGYPFRYLWCLSVLLYTIFATESFLFLNNVPNMDSIHVPGQRKEFLIGLGGLLPVLFASLYWRKSANFLFSRPPVKVRRLPFRRKCSF